MLEKLTPEQEKLIPVIRDKWINLAFSGKQLQHSKELREGINWFYKKAKLENPIIIITPSPYYAQLTANLIKNIQPDLIPKILKELKQKSRECGNNVWDNVRANVRANVWDNVWANVLANVGDNVWANVLANVGDNVRDNVEIIKLEFFSVYSGLDWSSGWLSFYDYFETIEVINNEEFKKYRNVFELGIWNCILFENVCIISMLPSKVLQSDLGRLHSTKEASVQFRDGYSVYCIHGVRFEEKLFKEITERKIKVKDILKLKNIEQRYIALEYYGFENILSELDAQLLDKSKRGNELYSIKFENFDLRLLKYSCPSTNRVYGSFVKPEIKKADQAMAWKHNMTEKEYAELSIEA